jgi:hypothetical protein
MLKTLCFVAVLAFVAEARLTPVVCKEPFAEMKTCMQTALTAADVNIDRDAIKECFADCALTSKMEKLKEFHDCMFDEIGESMNDCVEDKADMELEDVEEPPHEAIQRVRTIWHHNMHAHSEGHGHEHRHRSRRFRRSHHEHGAEGHMGGHSHCEHDDGEGHGHGPDHRCHGHHVSFLLRKAEECSPEAKTCVETALGEWATEDKQTELHEIVKKAKNDCIMAAPAECKDAMKALARAESECHKKNSDEHKAAKTKCMTDDIQALFDELTDDGHPHTMSLGFDTEY